MRHLQDLVRRLQDLVRHLQDGNVTFTGIFDLNMRRLQDICDIYRTKSIINIYFNNVDSTK